jgi:hypothetical protein
LIYGSDKSSDGANPEGPPANLDLYYINLNPSSPPLAPTYGVANMLVISEGLLSVWLVLLLRPAPPPLYGHLKSKQGYTAAT